MATSASAYRQVCPKLLLDQSQSGPNQYQPGHKSRFEYKTTAPRSGKYSFTAQVVMANYNQRLHVSVNDAVSEIAMEMPFTLEEGEDTLRFWREPAAAVRAGHQGLHAHAE